MNHFNSPSNGGSNNDSGDGDILFHTPLDNIPINTRGGGRGDNVDADNNDNNNMIGNNNDNEDDVEEHEGEGDDDNVDNDDEVDMRSLRSQLSFGAEPQTLLVTGTANIHNQRINPHPPSAAGGSDSNNPSSSSSSSSSSSNVDNSSPDQLCPIILPRAATIDISKWPINPLPSSNNPHPSPPHHPHHPHNAHNPVSIPRPHNINNNNDCPLAYDGTDNDSQSSVPPIDHEVIIPPRRACSMDFKPPLE